MLPSWVDLGADALVASGRIGADIAAAFKAEARLRIASGDYYGHIADMSVVARKPVMRGRDEAFQRFDGLRISRSLSFASRL